jgi:hypothetical protein
VVYYQYMEMSNLEIGVGGNIINKAGKLTSQQELDALNNELAQEQRKIAEYVLAKKNLDKEYNFDSDPAHQDMLVKLDPIKKKIEDLQKSLSEEVVSVMADNK